MLYQALFSITTLKNRTFLIVINGGNASFCYTGNYNDFCRYNLDFAFRTGFCSIPAVAACLKLKA